MKTRDTKPWASSLRGVLVAVLVTAFGIQAQASVAIANDNGNGKAIAITSGQGSEVVASPTTPSGSAVNVAVKGTTQVDENSDVKAIGSGQESEVITSPTLSAAAVVVNIAIEKAIEAKSIAYTSGSQRLNREVVLVGNGVSTNTGDQESEVVARPTLFGAATFAARHASPDAPSGQEADVGVLAMAA